MNRLPLAPHKSASGNGSRVIIAVAAGLLGGMTPGLAQIRGECGPAPALLIATTAGGGALGWLLAGD